MNEEPPSRPPSDPVPREVPKTPVRVRADKFVESVADRLDYTKYKEIDKVDTRLSRIIGDVEGFLNVLEEKMSQGLLKESDIKHIEKALGLMVQLHIGQKNRADGSGPFVKHPIEVAKGVLETYEEDDLADVCIAALLHDTIEDQAQLIRILHGSDSKESLKRENEHEERYFALEDFKELFGDKVGTLIRKVSTPLPLHKIDLTKKKKREKYYDFIKKIVNDVDDPAAFVIKWQDAHSNMLTIGKVWDIGNYFKEKSYRFNSEGSKSVGKDFKNAELEKKNIYKKLRDKYRPILEEILLPAFSEMQEGHPLYKHKDEAINEINRALEEQYNMDVKEESRQ